MSITEALSAGLQTTIIGLAIVFAVLMIIMGVLYCFKFIFSEEKTQKSSEPAAVVASEVPVQTEATAANVNEEELIAVLTAAVAASLNTSTYNLQIKSYRRTDNKMPAWNKAGVTETINNRF